MRADVLRAITEAKDVTNAIVLTHNIDFLFLQSMVLPALRKCGHPSLTVFADAGCAAESFEKQRRLVSGLGLRYRVVPVAMDRGFRFHPKAILLSGTRGATLLVGSGNLTFGGWRENGEIWLRYETGEGGMGPFTAFRSYLRDTLSRVPLSESVRSEVEEAFDPGTREWATDLAEGSSLIGKAGSGESLLDQMTRILAGRPVGGLHVCAPYFDSGGEALERVATVLGGGRATVLVQGRSTTLTQEAAARAGTGIQFRETTFRHVSKRGSADAERTREALLHAKIYAMDLGDEVLVLAGSANCSKAALLIPGRSGNAELMGSATLSKADFTRLILDELLVTEEEPALQPARDEPIRSSDEFGSIEVRAARREVGRLCVAFEVGSGTRLTGVELDGVQVSFDRLEDGSLVTPPTTGARTVVLLGEHGGQTLCSLPHWIDDEMELRSSARFRSLTDSIDRGVRAGSWSIGAWTEVLNELHKHLEYVPSRNIRGPQAASRQGGEIEGAKEFVWEDVFSEGYGLSLRSFSVPSILTEAGDRIGSLRALLLRWYGIEQADEDEAREGQDESPGPEAGGLTDENGDQDTDRPDPLPKAVARVDPPVANERERKKALRTVRGIAQRMADPEFLSEREPELLAGDLKIAAVLLRAGLADDWITEEELFEVTLKIWLPLFFNAADRESTGWIEQRLLTSPEGENFAERLCSVELAAALGCWALSPSGGSSSPERARFELACALGVARLPWLWQTGGNSKVAREIAAVFAHTSRSHEIDWEGIEARWLTLIRRGYALARLEGAMRRIEPRELRSRIKQAHVVAGELLWQPPYGFCVAEHACARSKGPKGSVLILQHGNAQKIYLGEFLLPVAGLLEEGVLEESLLPPRARSVVSEMVETVRVGFAPE